MLAPITPGRQGNVRHNLSGVLAYDSFRPANMDSFFPINLSADSMLLVSDCRAILGEVEGMSRFVPNIDMYLSMYVRKEALLSSQIEGAQCTFDDVLDPSNESNASRDLTDVVNYTRAVQQATKLMEELPLCMRLLKSVHATLLGNGRGSDKTPGQFRTTQNWVGPNGCTLNEAPYVPPNTEDMKEALGDLELFINERDDIDPVIKAALVHSSLKPHTRFSTATDASGVCSSSFRSYMMGRSPSRSSTPRMNSNDTGANTTIGLCA